MIILKDSTDIFNIWKMATKYNCDDFHNMLKHRLIYKIDKKEIMNLRKKIKSEVQKLGITIYRLSMISGLQKTQISKYLKGEKDLYGENVDKIFNSLALYYWDTCTKNEKEQMELLVFGKRNVFEDNTLTDNDIIKIYEYELSQNDD